jgi:hypothetical protein
MITYTYNSYNQPLTATVQHWNPTTLVWDPNADGQRYYYETYTTGINNISSINGKADIYPVPATSTCSIAVNWDEPQAFTISVVDMTGKVCSTLAVPECHQYTTSISVATLPAGNYIVKIAGAKGCITRQLTVIR